jgi:pimeloyl-ACP methyl ester carboxylesterase
VPADPNVRYTTVNGLKYAYLAEGGGPLVVLVHGFPDTAYTWDAVMPAVASAGYMAVAPFTRGYYPTACPVDDKFDVATLASDLVALIDQLRGNEASVVLVGHDWGAAAAYAAAALAPEKIRLLVTVGIPHPATLVPTPRLAWKLRHFVTLSRKSAPDKLAANDFAMVDELVRRWSPPGRELAPSETAHVKAAFAQPGSARAALGYYRAVGVRLPPLHRKKIGVPAVSFAGQHDMIAPAAYYKAKKMFTADYQVAEVPGGHFMHREHPAEFTSALLATLAKHPA